MDPHTAAAQGSPDAPRPLVVTDDPDLLDELLRLAAAAGVEAAVAPDPGAARALWGMAPLVLLDRAAATAVARLRLLSRPAVLVVTTAPVTPAHWEAAALAGAESVHQLPDAEPLLVARLRAGAVAGCARSIGVLGARGGAGASTFACALAGEAARRRSGDPASRAVLLVDGDPAGGGLDLVLGAESTPGLRWPDLTGARGRADPTELRTALPHVEGVTLLSWHRGDAVDLPVDAVTSVLRAGRAGHDLVVVDLARGAPVGGLPVDVFGGLGPFDLVLLLVPAEVRAVAAARAQAAVLAGQEVRLVVRGPAPAGLTAELVAGELGLPLVGWLPAEPAVARAQEHGEPPGRSRRGALARLCRRVLDDELPSLVGAVA